MIDRERRVLVTGCAGLLGDAICRSLADTSRVIGVYHDTIPSVDLPESYRVELTDEYAMQQTIRRSHPDVVFHCAGMVNVDSAEEDFDGAREVNALATRAIARHLPDDAVMVYISTDSVFDGRRGGYREDDVVRPLNNYAKSKLEGEWFVEQEAAEHLIVRTNFFGRKNGGGSFADWLHDSLSHHRTVRMAVDWRFSPIFVEDLVSALDALVSAGVRGRMNVAGSAPCSKYEFGAALANEYGFDASLVEPVHFSQLSFSAPRPQDMTLDVSNAEALLGRSLPSYVEGIRRMHETGRTAAR
jgi:dTDP-4-dehydrorhamnose reductase